MCRLPRQESDATSHAYAGICARLVNRATAVGLVNASENQRSVYATESKRIREDMLDALGAPVTRQKIQIARFVGNGEVHRRRKPFLFHCECADRCLDCARCAECVTVVTLR